MERSSQNVSWQASKPLPQLDSSRPNLEDRPTPPNLSKKSLKKMWLRIFYIFCPSNGESHVGGCREALAYSHAVGDCAIQILVFYHDQCQPSKEAFWYMWTGVTKLALVGVEPSTRSDPDSTSRPAFRAQIPAQLVLFQSKKETLDSSPGRMHIRAEMEHDAGSRSWAVSRRYL